MAIDREDFTFAKSDPIVKNIPYGSAGDCFSMHYGDACRRGHFKVDLALTGLRLRPSVQWKAIGFPPGIEMSEVQEIEGRDFCVFEMRWLVWKMPTCRRNVFGTDSVQSGRR